MVRCFWMWDSGHMRDQKWDVSWKSLFCNEQNDNKYNFWGKWVDMWRSDHNLSPAPLALLGQWCCDWMRWRWEGRDLPSLDERSPLLPRFSPHAASGDVPRGEQRPSDRWGSTPERWWGRSETEEGLKWKENKIQQDGFSSTSLVHSPCLSLVGLWYGVVDVLDTVGLPVDELQTPQHSSCWPLTQTWCAWRKLERRKSIWDGLDSE